MNKSISDSAFPQRPRPAGSAQSAIPAPIVRSVDSYQVKVAREEPSSFPAAPDELSFAPLTRHINAVLRGEQEPRLLAVHTALPTAQALHELAASAEQHR